MPNPTLRRSSTGGRSDFLILSIDVLPVAVNPNNRFSREVIARLSVTPGCYWP